MSYQEAVDYLFNSAPLFQNVGGEAYKEGLGNTLLLDDYFRHPHRKFKTVHVAGTNGKGSCCHTIAAILHDFSSEENFGKSPVVGLYTSPHLVDFRERIKIIGKGLIPQEYVARWVEENKKFFDTLHCSFFELTTALAFKYFADAGVDIAVIETGLGGRLDCTNIITPILSVITNISLDHTQFLGNTLEKIAAEKAGIIKSGTPVVIGETTSETKPVFTHVADTVGAPIIFAEEQSAPPLADITDLHGIYQQKNMRTVLTAMRVLIGQEAADRVFETCLPVSAATGLRGRWETVRRRPLVICDTGHNIGGWQYIARQIAQTPCHHLHVILGFVSDKDIYGILHLIRQEFGKRDNVTFYFTKASVKRAKNEQDLLQTAQECGLSGTAYPSVSEAYNAALSAAEENDFIFAGGSTFIVADLLKNL